MKAYTSLCARTADEAGKLLGLREDGTSRIMFAADYPYLHGHSHTGACSREWWRIGRVGASQLVDYWNRCAEKGREASTY